MKQGKYAAPVKRRRRRNTLKPMLIAMAVVLLLGCVTGGTLAWLTDTTDEVVNTFTVGNIDITLEETGAVNNAASFKMIPGWTIAKDPKVTVLANSEKCYLFVKVTKSDNFGDYMECSIAGDWKEVSGETNIYYCVVDTSTEDQEFKVLANDQVTVKNSVTREMMNNLTEANYPWLTVQAAAVQFYKSNGTEFGAVDALQEITWTPQT